MKMHEVLEDGYIYCGDLIDPVTQERYGLAIAPEDIEKPMKWDDIDHRNVMTKLEGLYLYETSAKFFNKDERYWVVAEEGNNNAWFERFSDGSQSYFSKNYLSWVRPIRRITYPKPKKSPILRELKAIRKLIEEKL